MTTKLYLHDATTTNTGTLPTTTKLSALTIGASSTGAGTNRAMTITKGTLQVSITLASVATLSTQNNWFRRFISAPLAAQTLGDGLTAFQMATATSSSNISNSNFFAYPTFLGVWRPTSNAVVQSWTTSACSSNTATSESANLLYPISDFGTFACLDGDMLVVEFGGQVTQAMATSYTWTDYYDGTTEDSATTNASYLWSPTTLLFSTPPPPNKILYAPQAVNRSTVY